MADPHKVAKIAGHVRIAKLFGKHTKRRRIPKQQYPKLIEADYAKRIIDLLARSREVIRQHTKELPSLVAAAQRERQDAGESGRIKELIARAKRALEEKVQPTEIEALAKLFGERTSTFQRVQLGRQTRAALGVDVFASDRKVPTLIQHFAAENAALIKTIPQDQLSRVEKLATRAITGGTTVDEFTKQLDEGFDVSERHARLIARDQVGKLNGQLNEYRQTDLGIESYIWQTAGDERVREEHQALDGKEFRWDDPPEEGNPGEPIQCRCTAQPNFSSILDAIAE